MKDKRFRKIIQTFRIYRAPKRRLPETGNARDATSCLVLRDGHFHTACSKTAGKPGSQG